MCRKPPTWKTVIYLLLHSKNFGNYDDEKGKCTTVYDEYIFCSISDLLSKIARDML